VGWPPPPPPSVCHAAVRAVQEHTARRPRRAPALHEPGHTWRVAPGGEALQALRGVPGTGAVTLVAALGALPRFASPRELRPCLGLGPAASASGAHRRQGARTKAGHPQARRVLVDGAWASRAPAPGRRQGPLRRATQPQIIQDIRGKAPGRRCNRYRRLVARGTHAQVVTVARARERAGCLGARAREGSLTP